MRWGCVSFKLHPQGRELGSANGGGTGHLSQCCLFHPKREEVGLGLWGLYFLDLGLSVQQIFVEDLLLSLALGRAMNKMGCSFSLKLEPGLPTLGNHPFPLFFKCWELKWHLGIY